MMPESRLLTALEISQDRQRVYDSMQDKGYKRVWIDTSGAVCVEVDAERTHEVVKTVKDGKGRCVKDGNGRLVKELVTESVYANASMFRQAWGLEWPVVRSSVLSHGVARLGDEHEFNKRRG
jgi:hypothetical protein